MAASTLNDAAAHLRDAGLILPSGEPELPDLFWALAAVWRPLRVNPVATIPEPVAFEHQSPNLDDLSADGWAQGGDQAALAWGAPMFALGSRPWVWVPNQIAARRVERVLGPATWDDHAAVIVVPPTPLACVDRQHAPSGTLAWPTLHPPSTRSASARVLDSLAPAGASQRPAHGLPPDRRRGSSAALDPSSRSGPLT